MAINFPDAPTLNQVFQGYYWDGEKWMTQGSIAGAVRYDVAQGLSANQRSQARSNIGDLKKNYVINGAMMISQENGTVGGSISGYYPVDQWHTVNSSSGTVIAAQVSSPTAGGSPNRIRMTVNVADAALGAGDLVMFRQVLEGLRITDLRLGSAAAKTVTVQFGVKAPAGTYCVAILNGIPNRAYVTEYVVAAGEANTDVIKSVTIQLDTTGTWAADNTIGFYLGFTLMGGSTYQTAANSWAGGNFWATSNQFNFMASTSNVFELFDVSLTEGNVAPPFMVPDYASELALCKRYFQFLEAGQVVGGPVASNSVYFGLSFSVKMRAAPTLSGPGGNSVIFLTAQNTEASSANAPSINVASTSGMEFQIAGFGGLTGGQVCFWRRTDTGTKIMFSARL
jgi:hypothetical protein